MFPALGFEGLKALWGADGDGWFGFAGAQDAANARDGDSGDGIGDAGRRGGGEEELVVFSAVERLGEGCGEVGREERGVDFGGDARFFAEVGEISGEAVADVDCGSGEMALPEPEALSKAGLGIEVRSEQVVEVFGNSHGTRAGGLWVRRSR